MSERGERYSHFKGLEDLYAVESMNPVYESFRTLAAEINKDKVKKDKQIKHEALMVTVKTKYEEEILKFPNVVGVGVGHKTVKGEPLKDLCIKVYVEKKFPLDKLSELRIDPIRPKYEGLKTDVDEVGSLRALANIGRIRPVLPGYSIGHTSITAGTLGCLVKNVKDGEILILSNNHVIGASNTANVGDKILQPGPADGGRHPQDDIAMFERSVPLMPPYNLVDSAVARPINSRIVVPYIEEVGIPRGVSTVKIDDEVTKVGRTTGKTNGIVTDTNATVMVNIEDSLLLFKNQIITTPMLSGGDSGSLLLNSDYKGVGLSFAGSGVRSFHNHLINVLIALNIELVTAS